MNEQEAIDLALKETGPARRRAGIRGVDQDLIARAFMMEAITIVTGGNLEPRYAQHLATECLRFAAARVRERMNSMAAEVDAVKTAGGSMAEVSAQVQKFFRPPHEPPKQA